MRIKNRKTIVIREPSYNKKKETNKMGMKTTTPLTQKGYRIKKESLHKKVLDRKQPGINEFENYLIQEGVKQILFSNGSKTINRVMKNADNSEWITGENYISKEMIKFLLDYDIIEEYEFEISDYKTT